MEIKNEALLKMLDSASKLKKQKENELKEEDKKLLDNLPSVVIPSVNFDDDDEYETSAPNLSLDPDRVITRDSMLSNVSVKERRFKNGSLESLNRAKRKVGRLTTGASAAIPLVCQGVKCPFKARCVHEDTLVFTPYGFTKIKDLKTNQIIYSFNKEGCLEKDKVTNVINSGLKETYTITTKYGFKLTLTSDHPVLSCTDAGERDFISIDQGLTKNSTIFIVDEDLNININTLDFGDLFEDTVEEIVFNEIAQVYDITIKDNSNFIANNIAVHNCPYFKEDLHEVGEDCLVEEQLVQYWTQKYADELEVDYNSISEMHMVSSLVEINIMELRMNNYLAINDQALMMEFIASVDPQGNILSNKGVSVALDIKERLQRQKLKILETLNNTREKKAKLIIDSGQSVSKENSKNLLNKLDKLYNKLNNSTSPQTIDAEVIDLN